MSISMLLTDVTEMHNGSYCVAGWDFGKVAWFGHCLLEAIGRVACLPSTACNLETASKYTRPERLLGGCFLTAQKT